MPELLALQAVLESLAIAIGATIAALGAIAAYLSLRN